MVDYAGRTLLHEAAGGGHLRATNLVLGLKETWHSTPDYAGATPLHEAVTNGHLDVCKQLLFAGCDANVQDSAG